MKHTQLLFLAYICLGCTSAVDTNTNTNTLIEISTPVLIDTQQGEVLARFDDHYAVELSRSDSLLFIQQVKTNYHYIAYNLKSGILTDSLVSVGNAPNSLLYPEFVSCVEGSGVVILDRGFGRLFSPEFQMNSFSLKPLDYLPVNSKQWSEISISENFIVGRKLALGEPSMFFIYNKKDSVFRDISPLPQLHNELVDPNYTYASVLALNEAKNRVLAGLYFFDLIHLYDLEGNHIKSIHFSENSIPLVRADTKDFDLSAGYSGIIRVYSTQEYCYLLRTIEGPEHIQKSDKMLLQLNWEGELVQAYAFEDDIMGRFHIDEINKKLYIIRHRFDGDDTELFEVMCYQL